MQVEQNSGFTMHAAFTLRGRASVPTTVEWRIKCIETDTYLNPWTTLTPTTATGIDGDPSRCTVSFEVAGSLHAMQTSCDRERRALIIVANRGLSSDRPREIVYDVVRLHARD